MTFYDVDASPVEYQCSVPIVFATLDVDGTGMVGSVSYIFHFFGDFHIDTFFASDQKC